jgi:L-ascorbate metabolism protein UlaG (beta-lactamase superfamily)
MRVPGSAAVILSVLTHAAAAQQRPAPDSLPAPGNDMVIVAIAHATLQIVYGSNVILVDPTTYGGYDGPHPDGVPRLDYAGLKPPTLVVVTDIHGDHFDEQAIATLRTPGTKVVVPAISGWQWSIADVIPLANRQMRTIDGVTVEAVAMYNLSRGPRSGQLFHVKGRGNGYVLTIGESESTWPVTPSARRR